VSEARHVALERVELTVTPTFEMTGSILADTVAHRLSALETHLELTAAAPREVVRQLVATAERMCFVLDAIQRPHAVHRTVLVNGAPLD